MNYQYLIFSFLINCFSLVIPACSQSKYPDFETYIFQNKAGDILPYRLLSPENYDATKEYPLVIFFHGSGERGTDNEITLTHIAPLFLEANNRKNYPCFVLVPQCPKDIKWVDTDWGAASHTMPQNPSMPMELSIALIDYAIENYAIDTARIYTTGLSMGGFAVWDIIARKANKFAAAIPICGGGDEKTASIIKNIPIWAFHGALDKVVFPSRSRNMIKALKEEGGTPKYTEFPDVAHGSWVPAYKQEGLLEWLFSQKKK